MAFVQIGRKSGLVKRVPRGEEPFVELALEPHERIIELQFSEEPKFAASSRERKTVDWRWVAMVEHRFLRSVPRDALLMAIKDALTYTDPNDLEKGEDGRGAFAPILDALEVPEDQITSETGLALIAGLQAHGWRLSDGS